MLIETASDYFIMNRTATVSEKALTDIQYHCLPVRADLIEKPTNLCKWIGAAHIRFLSGNSDLVSDERATNV
jgi:hypothetical protein